MLLMWSSFGPALSGPPAELPRDGVGTWDSDTLGNHRAVLRVEERADAVLVRIPWRRRDVAAGDRGVILIDASTDRPVGNLLRIEVNREFGEFVFQPQTVPSDYYLYYLPYTLEGRRNYPTTMYRDPSETKPETAWLERNSLASTTRVEASRALPTVRVQGIESIDEFNSPSPMEVAATDAEVAELIRKHGDAPFLLFPERRDRPIRMKSRLPWHWVQDGPQETFAAEVMRGEFFVFQIGVFASGAEVRDLRVDFDDLRADAGTLRIDDSRMRCFNLGGIDWEGKPFEKRISVPLGTVQPLWIGIDIPADLEPGTYRGAVHVGAESSGRFRVGVELSVLEKSLDDAGDSDPQSLSRLRWLDSAIAADETVVRPFTPVEVVGKSLRVLGRHVRIGESGFPEDIQSLFAPEMTRLQDQGREILARPIRLTVVTSKGEAVRWDPGEVDFTVKTPARARWRSRSESENLSLQVLGELEFDGNIEFEATLEASRPMMMEDVFLEIPLRADIARYMMGLGRKGGLRPSEFDWKWDREKNQDSVWVGDVNGGLQVSLKDRNYSRPLNTNFYLLKPLNLPPSWYNGGRGGMRLSEMGSAEFLIKAYSGRRVMQPGDRLHFNFRLLITPFKTIDPRSQWKTRYYHRYADLGEVVEAGANTINVHHATEINPFINYPFLRTDELRKYIQDAHSRNLRVKIYYTVRELSNRAPELFPLLSLGDEVISDGRGGGTPWLSEHVESNYIPGWYVPALKDEAVINSGTSRWHNYYLEGLNWLVRNVGIDGIYIDDVAFDRTIMKRVRRILDQGDHPGLIDLHSANQFNVRDGFANSANLYLEHFPYIDRLWFGEYFDYGSAPDFWMVEVSGIPFGLMGEMLQDGGNPWRGMVYGMTGRLPWAGDPRPVWAVWDQFGLEDAEMVGYWVESSPVKADREDVLTTTFLKPGEALVTVASWAPEQAECRLDVDWEKLGFDPDKVVITAPAIRDFQAAAELKPGESLTIEPGRGRILILKEGRFPEEGQ